MCYDLLSLWYIIQLLFNNSSCIQSLLVSSAVTFTTLSIIRIIVNNISCDCYNSFWLFAEQYFLYMLSYIPISWDCSVTLMLLYHFQLLLYHILLTVLVLQYFCRLKVVLLSILLYSLVLSYYNLIVYDPQSSCTIISMQSCSLYLVFLVMCWV